MLLSTHTTIHRGVWLRTAHTLSKGRLVSMAATPRPAKEEGSIASVFTSLTGEAAGEHPPRFASLKRGIWRDGMVESWRQVLSELEVAAERVARLGSEIVPKVSYADIERGLSEEQVTRVKETGTVIVTGGVPKEEALSWKQAIRDYAAANQERVRGFPADNIQVFELYNSLPQLRARTHPSILATQKALLSLWHTSNPASPISLDTPISYFDRLRIRQPGDAKFALGPHIDGGSVERWEDPAYRQCFGRILEGGEGWKAHDPFDVSPRIDAKQDMYNASNQCSILRPWQGWTSLSSTGPNEGTLRVLPLLSLASAYIMLRPFFRPRHSSSSSLAFADWEPDLEGPAFPGSALAKAQELNEATHPHLRLGETMVSIPRVEPGDQVYWHCDVVHAVEAKHAGVGDSSVLYIPAAPLTVHNALYLRDQRTNFISGHPAPDFPGGEGESKFVGRAKPEDLGTPEARKMFGFERLESGLNPGCAEEANKILFG
ncbi:hypothetical protein BDZ94DRAFT_1262752 [Collybia nuda]|uniref:DUF1479-domain-containing protein n=1 Tax=Collybia nuda TaxID=64659 RepID=A0A9P5Y208_9AGAR|nr:hypothetical protein BDZ94DRAFT_1262752 [Collybia nuda]